MSSFALQSVSLIDSKRFVLFGLNLVGNVCLSILALVLGRSIMLAIMRPSYLTSILDTCPPKWTAGEKITEHCKNHPIRKA